MSTFIDPGFTPEDPDEQVAKWRSQSDDQLLEYIASDKAGTRRRVFAENELSRRRDAGVGEQRVHIGAWISLAALVAAAIAYLWPRS